MNIDQMLDQIRGVIGRVDRSISEREVMESLVEEADTWRARLFELEDDEGGG
jgi:hypothetical protein